MNEFEQIRFCDYKLVVDTGTQHANDDNVEYDDEDLELEDLIDIDEEEDLNEDTNIYSDNHWWDFKQQLPLRFFPQFWKWYPHELYDLEKKYYIV